MGTKNIGHTPIITIWQEVVYAAEDIVIPYSLTKVEYACVSP